MAKLADAPDLGSGVSRRVGSSPIRRTNDLKQKGVGRQQRRGLGKRLLACHTPKHDQYYPLRNMYATEKASTPTAISNIMPSITLSGPPSDLFYLKAEAQRPGNLLEELAL